MIKERVSHWQARFDHLGITVLQSTVLEGTGKTGGAAEGARHADADVIATTPCDPAQPTCGHRALPLVS